MEIKGTAVSTTPQYVKNVHPEKYDEWAEALPSKSKDIVLNSVYATNWYPLMDAVLVPTRILGELCFDGDEKKAGWEIGRYSAETALKGIYKVFCLINSPKYMLSRAAKVFGTYYNNATIEVTNATPNSTSLILNGFSYTEISIFNRIAGWCEKALEIMKASDIEIAINNIGTEHDPTIEIALAWK